jgi:hypothetical protein
MFFLPRHARDKQKEYSKKDVTFSFSLGFVDGPERVCDAAGGPDTQGAKNGIFF